MKKYKIFIGIFAVLLVVYIYMEATKPKPVNWSVSLKENDKNPYGAYIMYHSLRDYFPESYIHQQRIPVYSLLTSRDSSLISAPTAYILISDRLRLSKEDIKKLLSFVKKGNYVFLSAQSFEKTLLDTLGLKKEYLSENLKDSTYINFTDSRLKRARPFTFRRETINSAFKISGNKNRIKVLGTTQNNKPNFLKVDLDKGSVFLHASPLVFSNLFYLTGDNADYSNKVISHIPRQVKNVHWDEYYKQGMQGPRTPLRVLLSNYWTKWALYLGMLLLLIYVFFAAKRKQRVIPVIKPLENKSLQFAETIASLYYNKKDNRLIANKKLMYFSDFVRQRYGTTVQLTDSTFAETLARRSAIDIQLIKKITAHAYTPDEYISDEQLKNLNHDLETFYKSVKA